jgi:hypothetical protein
MLTIKKARPAGYRDIIVAYVVPFRWKPESGELSD